LVYVHANKRLVGKVSDADKEDANVDCMEMASDS